MEVSMTRRLLCVLTIALLAATGCGRPSARQQSSRPSAAPDVRLAGSYRFDRNGWIFVHLEGPPATIGYQHGYLLAAETADLLRVYRAFTEHQTRHDWAFFRTAAEQILWPKMEPEYQQEIDGIVAGLTAKKVTADRWDIVALNAVEELPEYYVPWLEKQQGLKPSQKAPGNCSAFVATGSFTKDGKIVIGHNAWTNYVTGSRWQIVFDLTPQRGYRILMDGLPGVIVSDDDFGINSNGIMVTETTITGFEGFDPNGVPEFMRARKALQYSRSIDEYVQIMLAGNNGAYANDWLVGDNKTGEIARFELGLNEHSVERTKDGYFVGSNFPVGAKLIRNETTFDAKKRDSSSNARRTRWEQLMAQYKGQIDVELGKQFEGDKYDVIEKKDGPTERSLCGLIDTSPRGVPEWNWPAYYPGGTVQSKVTDGTLAQSMQMWAAMGHQCAPDFKADAYLQQHPEFGWARGLLRDMPTGPWTLFAAGGR
jgi:Phospholipase B